MKHEFESLRRQRAEQGRPQQDAEDDLADRGGLAHAAREHAADPAREHDDREFQQRGEQQ